MDGYPIDYIGHNLPFVILYGIGSTESKPLLRAEKDFPLLEKGPYISSESPNVTGPVADQVLSSFHEFDARDASWNNKPGTEGMGRMGFAYRTVGRALTLPPRKANNPINTEEITPNNRQWTQSAPTVLHSPLSPLTHGSPTFPDGIMSSLWFSKHQCLLPSAIISFFDFTMESSTSILHDNRLKNDINGLRASITTSSYKPRLLVILIADSEGSEMLINDRVANIRRGTNLDPRSLFIILHGLSRIELGSFVGTVLATLQPSCMEYYRDLSKHARRKRNRGSIPSPTGPSVAGTSRILTAQEWNVRYETKLGYFAEFRQEMDAAGHNYEAAYELLVDGEIFDGIASWSPRFDEARMLADVLATRILRCLLWTGQTTSAAQSWANHRWRILDLLDSKGKGSTSYGWQAWEARWSSVMAELIEQIDIPIFHVPKQLQSDSAELEVIDIYAIPEKSFSQEERLPPWDLLHHEGYWYRRSAQKTMTRRKLAMLMPKEDRVEPGQSPAYNIASRTHLYDTYLCPEPHYECALEGKETFDHSALLIETVGRAALNFSKRQQKRAVERAGLDIAQEHIRSGRWQQAWTLLGPLWKNLSWRTSGWWILVEEVSWAVRACARNLDDGETLIAVEWELMSNLLTRRTNWQHDLSRCLDGLDLEDRPHAIIDASSLAPSMTASFTFGIRSGSVGEILPAQLTVTSQTQPTSTSVRLTEIEITFDGGLRAIVMSHSDLSEPLASLENGKVEYFETKAQDSKYSTAVSSPTTPLSQRSFSTLAELTFLPGNKKVFLLNLIPRDSGEVKATQVILRIREESFYFDVGVKLPENNRRVYWWYTQGESLLQRKLHLEQHTSIAILPKPPKLQIELPTWRKTYYFNEMVYIAIRLRNEENEIADIQLHIHLNGVKAPRLNWSLEDSDEMDLEGRSLGQISPGESGEYVVSFHAPNATAEFSFQVLADYVLIADPQTPITKSIKHGLQVIAPFEANYEFQPRIHPEPWPSYFNVDTIHTEESGSRGLKQNWSITIKIASFAAESLTINAVTLEVLDTTNCLLSALTTRTPIPTVGITIQPSVIYEHQFFLEIQKASLEDHRHATLTFNLDISWERSSPFPSGVPAISTLLVPPLTLAFGEPRLIATSSTSMTDISMINMTYTLENPSMHILTFSLSMEASEEFAFSGPKNSTVRLLPLSRNTIKYNIFPAKQGIWLKPSFKCLDLGFGKVLRCLAGKGCRIDRQRGLVIWAHAE